MNNVVRKALETALLYEEQLGLTMRGRQATLRKDADGLEKQACVHEANAAELRAALEES